MKNMRSLTEEEKALVKKVASRSKNSKIIVPDSVSYQHNGNHTVAAVTKENKSGTVSVYVGISKRNPNDTFNPAIGESLAFVRAIRAKDPVCVV